MNFEIWKTNIMQSLDETCQVTKEVNEPHFFEMEVIYNGNKHLLTFNPKMGEYLSSRLEDKNWKLQYAYNRKREDIQIKTTSLELIHKNKKVVLTACSRHSLFDLNTLQFQAEYFDDKNNETGYYWNGDCCGEYSEKMKEMMSVIQEYEKNLGPNHTDIQSGMINYQPRV